MPLSKIAEIFPAVPLWIKVLAVFLPMLPNMWCIWQANTKTFKEPLEKRLWLFAGIFLPVAGGLLFLIWGRRRIVPPPDKSETN